MYQLTESDKKDLIDIKMTSNTTPAPYVASASSVFNNNAEYQPWKAFNGTNNDRDDCWASGRGVNNGWIQLDFNRLVNIRKIILVHRTDLRYNYLGSKDFDIESSVNGVDFKKEKEVINESQWGINEYRAFDVNINQARIIRINVKKTNGISEPLIAQILFIENTTTEPKLLLRHTKTGKIYTIKEGSFS